MPSSQLTPSLRKHAPHSKIVPLSFFDIVEIIVPPGRGPRDGTEPAIARRNAWGQRL
jgi:hypothetical protein